jgi:hypothetical protein
MAVFIAADIRDCGNGLMEFVRTVWSRTLFQSMISSAGKRPDPKRHTTANVVKDSLSFMVTFLCLELTIGACSADANNSFSDPCVDAWCQCQASQVPDGKQLAG